MIDKNKIKSYSEDKKQGIVSAISTILQASGMNLPGFGGQGESNWDERLKQPNLNSPQNGQSNNKNKPNQDPNNKDNQTDSGNNDKNKQLNQDKIEEIRKLVKELRNAADDVIDDNDQRINPDQSNDTSNDTSSDESNKPTDGIQSTAKDISDKAKELEKDIKQDNNPEQNIDGYKKRLEKIADFWDDDTIEDVKKEIGSGKEYQELRKRLKAELKQALSNKVYYRNVKTVNIDGIVQDIVHTLKTDPVTYRNSDYRHYNPRSELFGRPVPGRFQAQKNNKIPTIGVFFDESGSWTGDAIKYSMEEKLTASIIKLEEQKKIKLLPIFYFADTTSTNKKEVGSGNSDAPVPYIKKLIENQQLDNAIIMTDNNPSTEERVQLPGYLWLLFYDTVAESFVKNLSGKKGTSVYMINHDAEDAEAAKINKNKKANKKAVKSN